MNLINYSMIAITNYFGSDFIDLVRDGINKGEFESLKSLYIFSHGINNI